MRTVSLVPFIVDCLLDLATAIPEIYLDFDVDQIELQYREDDEAWDIVFVESDDVEVILGTVYVDDEFNAVFDIFTDENEDNDAELLVDEA